MKTLKLMFLVVAILAISAPAFAACGICADNGSGTQLCDGTPNTPCRMVFHIDYIVCFDGQGFCRPTAAPEAASAQWVVASVETNGVVTAAEVPQTRTARLDPAGAGLRTDSR